MVYFYQLFLSTDDVILKLYITLCQKAKCTLFVWSTVVIAQLSGIFGSKPTESEGYSPRTRFVYVAINP